MSLLDSTFLGLHYYSRRSGELLLQSYMSWDGWRKWGSRTPSCGTCWVVLLRGALMSCFLCDYQWGRSWKWTATCNTMMAHRYRDSIGRQRQTSDQSTDTTDTGSRFHLIVTLDTCFMHFYWAWLERFSWKHIILACNFLILWIKVTKGQKRAKVATCWPTV